MECAAVGIGYCVQLNNMPGRSQLHPISSVVGIGKGTILILYQRKQKECIGAGPPGMEERLTLKYRCINRKPLHFIS